MPMGNENLGRLWGIMTKAGQKPLSTRSMGLVQECNIPTLATGPNPIVAGDQFDISLGTWNIVVDEWDTNGVRYTKVSLSPFTADNEVSLTAKQSYEMPFQVDAGLSISQRLVGVECCYGIIGVDANEALEQLTPPADLSISGNITVATNIWTINFPSDHGLVPNDRICLVGNTDSRLNVWPVRITSIVNRNSITITSTLANGTYVAGGVVKIIDPMAFAVNGANFTLDTATATQGINATRTAGNSKFENPAYTIGTTAPAGTPAVRSQSIVPSTEYTIEAYPDYCNFTTLAVDSLTTLQTLAKRTNQIPDANKKYKIRYRAKNLPNFSAPIARITSAAKTGTTTATIVTDVPHGLTTNDFIQIQGVRDIANFPNLVAATQVASIIDATTFTVIQGSAVTASSQDGVVFKMNGAGTIANGTSTRGISSIQATGNELTLGISGTVTTTVLVGDTVSVYGLAPALQSEYEGIYLVIDNSGSSIICKPLNSSGAARSVADIVSTPTGGMYIRRVDFIIHWTRAKETPRQSVELVGSDLGSDVSRAVKAYILNTLAVTMTSTTLTGGQAAHSAAVSGNPLRTGGKVISTTDTTLTGWDTADTAMDANAATLVKPYQTSDLCWTYAAAAGGITTTGDVAIKAAGAASIRNYLTSLQVQNTSATATELVIKDGASTILHRMYCPANMPLTPVEINVPLRWTAATALNAAILTAGAAVYVNAQGYSGL